jgi:hypothetical protein
MTEPEIATLEKKLDDVLARLKETRDPQLRRSLLAEMRGLMAELDRFVLDPTRFHHNKPDPST